MGGEGYSDELSVERCPPSLEAHNEKRPLLRRGRRLFSVGMNYQLDDRGAGL
jgi:hypothetical protein